MNEKKNLLKLENQLCFSIYAAAREFTKLYRPFLQQYSLTYPQYLVLLVLWEHTSLTVKEVGEQLYLDSGTLTPLLKRMEEAGYIVRQRSKEDERKVIVTLTEKGTELQEEARQIPLQLQHKVDIPHEKYVQWLRMMNEIMETISK